tara:strand:+ start:52 stop:204 length:153 start_codon:yes stop_codon:yes gene_type:complete
MMEVSDELKKKIREKIKERKRFKEPSFWSFWIYAIGIPLILIFILGLLSS